MKMLLFALALVPTVAMAQSVGIDFNTGLLTDTGSRPVYQPSYPIAVQPILPVPRDNGPWGTGYSVVTTTRQKRPSPLLGPDFSRDVTDSETITQVVPNDALRNPITAVDIW